MKQKLKKCLSLMLAIAFVITGAQVGTTKSAFAATVFTLPSIETVMRANPSPYTRNKSLKVGQTLKIKVPVPGEYFYLYGEKFYYCNNKLNMTNELYKKYCNITVKEAGSLDLYWTVTIYAKKAMPKSYKKKKLNVYRDRLTFFDNQDNEVVRYGIYTHK